MPRDLLRAVYLGAAFHLMRCWRSFLAQERAANESVRSTWRGAAEVSDRAPISRGVFCSEHQVEPMSELKDLMLKSPRLTLATAESLTCGRVQARIGIISGASDFFFGGITAYSLEQKVRHLGVESEAAKVVNSVSQDVAQQMAEGACRLFSSDLAVSTTGYAEASPAWNVSQPFAWWALAHRQTNGIFIFRAARVEFAGLSRLAVQEEVTDAVLTALTGYLKEVRSM